MEEVWLSHGWQPGQTVWRLEFQLRRTPVVELGVKEIGSLMLMQASVWRYLTTEWLRLAVPNYSDQTKSRWLTHPLWEYLSNYSWDIQNTLDINRVEKERVPEDTYLFQTGLSAVTGYMAKKSIDKLEAGLDQYLFDMRQHYIDESRLTGETLASYVNEKVRLKARKYNTIKNKPRSQKAEDRHLARAVSYTHLTLPTNREV